MIQKQKEKQLHPPSDFQKKKSSFLQKFFEDIKTESKSTNLQRKLVSKSFNIRRTESIKISQSNFKQVLITLAHRILKKNESSNQLLEKINLFLKGQEEISHEQITSILIKISYKKDTFDIMTPLGKIKKQITEQLMRKNNPLNKIIFQIWYSYIAEKYKPQFYLNPLVFKNQFHKDLIIFSEYMANIIFHLYRQWFYYIQTKKEIYPFLQKEFIPQLLTMSSNSGWDKIYKNILICLGQKKIVIDYPLTLNDFDIDPKFMSQIIQSPFSKSIQIIQQIYDNPQLKVKISKLKDLARNLRQQIEIHQKILISQGILKENQQIDVDNSVSCFSYCVFKSKKAGVAQALDYLELFFRDNNSDSSQFLQDLGIGHIMATLKSAALYLRQKYDQQLEKEKKRQNNQIIK